MNLELNVAINFQFSFFGRRIDQSITLQATKVPRGEDPSAEMPMRGGVRGKGTEGGRKEEGAFYLSMLITITEIIWSWGYVPLNRLWISGKTRGSWQFHYLAPLTGWEGRSLVLVSHSFCERASEKKREVRSTLKLFSAQYGRRKHRVRDSVARRGKNTHKSVCFYQKRILERKALVRGP